MKRRDRCDINAGWFSKRIFMNLNQTLGGFVVSMKSTKIFGGRCFYENHNSFYRSGGGGGGGGWAKSL